MRILRGGVGVFLLLSLGFGLLRAQYDAGDSVAIVLTIVSCPMRFELDSLCRHPTLPGMPEQDTCFLPIIYRDFLEPGHDSLEWETTYLVGQIVDAAPTIQAIAVKNTGCVPLDFELTTHAITLSGDPWWTPSDTSEPGPNQYVLRAIATGAGTPRLTWADSVYFEEPRSLFYVIHDDSHPIEIARIDTSLGAEPAYCCFYSDTLYGWSTIPTIRSSGVALRGMPPDSSGTDWYFYLHVALTTPLSAYHGTSTEHLAGYIVLTIRAKPMD